MESILKFDIAAQPDDTTCGPTCLHSVYQYFQDEVPLENVIREVPVLKGGGTLAVFLACHALKRGYRAIIYTYNLQIFDPTWFLPGVDLADKLRKQQALKNNEMLRFSTKAYIEVLELGGMIKFEDLNSSLIRKYLKESIPVLTGLSSTYLYGHAREFGPKCDHDDLRGEPAGHFVVLSGYSQSEQKVLVADPLMDNPFSPEQKYMVKMDKLICAILLGILTNDANLLIIEPKNFRGLNVNSNSSQQH